MLILYHKISPNPEIPLCPPLQKGEVPLCQRVGLRYFPLFFRRGDQGISLF
jgi:hypothetical protein